MTLELQYLLIRHNTLNAMKMEYAEQLGEERPYEPFGTRFEGMYKGLGYWNDNYQTDPYTLSPSELLRVSKDYLIKQLNTKEKIYTSRDHQVYQAELDYNNDGVVEKIIVSKHYTELDCDGCHVVENIYLVDHYNNLDRRFYGHRTSKLHIDIPFMYDNRTWKMKVFGVNGYPRTVVLYEIKPPYAGNLPPINFSYELCKLKIAK